VVAEALVDGHHRADAIHPDLLGGSGTEENSPELLAFLQRPRISALIDRDDELGDGAQDLEELGFCGFHTNEPPLNARFPRENTSAAKLLSDGFKE
jgi:hypothetical protein